VRFLGFVPHDHLIDLLPQAHVYVSVPESDATALSTLEAMACGCFPVVSDLPSQDGLITDGVNGFRVPVGDPVRLAEKIALALSKPELRRAAAISNQALVRSQGLLEPNMQILEGWYRKLAGRDRQT
jgi:glycosyltransferase involved in cell wall biosynthesis